MSTKFSPEYLNGNYLLGDVGIHGRIISKSILDTTGMKGWAGLSCFSIRFTCLVSIKGGISPSPEYT
jgi:hypothetical protein